MTNVAQEGDLVLLIARDYKRFLVRLQSGGELQTHRGVLSHDDLIGQPLGREIHSHLGYPFLVLEPSITDLIQDIKRTTQIMYPKDIGYVLLRMNIASGRQVIEAGTGSGGLTLALARAVAPTGRVYSYEVRPDVVQLAARNLEWVGLREYVELKERDIAGGFDEQNVDALFLDVRRPWDYLSQAEAALKGGGFFGCIVPTTNQVVRVLQTLPEYGFSAIEVEELLLRPYKAIAARLRPMDRIIAHTGYLIFARRIDRQTATVDWGMPPQRPAHETRAREEEDADF
ncbi:MAG: tRNA (adenine-N1)-methyltransferase [Anaerolineae bacterium]|jgi:tRNA (adenine57-N1/adenine58-N1)-methyltransferase|nr:tRNA (adenine-N1)-methyltransferase [Anaerolineae bacterium]MDH7474833.1 tRNA (adenine-N1)-methyltransferase [Anaerolineae bacterium]